MALLGGFMIGSLRLMWPFQRDLTPLVEKLKHKRYEQFIPEGWDREVTLCLCLAIVAIVAVLSLERWGSSAKKKISLPLDDSPGLADNAPNLGLNLIDRAIRIDNVEFIALQLRLLQESLSQFLAILVASALHPIQLIAHTIQCHRRGHVEQESAIRR